MDFTFINSSGAVAFFRSDAESAKWTQEEFQLSCTFPLVMKKVIERGMIVLFQDPATDAYQAYEIRQCITYASEGYQQFTAEDLAIAELTDCHVPDKIEFTNVKASEPIKQLLKGTGWSVGTDTTTETSSGDVNRGSVWDAVCTIRTNWNIVVLPRVTVDSSGIKKKYLDLLPAGGTWRGLRLAVKKNLDDPCLTYDDTELYTALYAYGGTYTEGTGESAKTVETTIENVVWSKNSKHPAKPKGQKYIEDPTKTALYGRNGKPRFGYYQNESITDPNILIQKAWESLKACYEPKVSITGTLLDLKRFGYADQSVRLYDLAIIEIEPLGVQFYKQIIQLTTDLLDPSNSEPNIGDYIPNIIYINRETDDDATGGGKGRGGGTRQQKEFSEFVTDLNRNQKDVWGFARKVDEHGNILTQAGFFIDPETGVLIYADDNENMIGAKFEVTAGAIKTEVEDRKEADKGLKSSITQVANRVAIVVDDKTGKIKAASIVAEINNGSSNIQLSADHIDIDGVVDKLKTHNIEAGNITGDIITGQSVVSEGDVSGDTGTFSTLTVDDVFDFDNHYGSWKSATLKSYTLSSPSRYFAYFNSITHEYMGSVLGQLVTGESDTTIHYLGY